MFTAPVGMRVLTNDGDHIKTEEDTNLYESGRLVAPQSFALKAIRCVFVGTGVPPCDAPAYADAHFRFSINRKTYWEGPAFECMLPDPKMFLALKKKDREKWVRLSRKRLEPAPMIGNEDNFFLSVSLRGSFSRYTPKVSPHRLVVLLEGALLRPVQ